MCRIDFFDISENQLTAPTFQRCNIQKHEAPDSLIKDNAVFND